MRCPNCGYENRPGARFCGRCGQPTSAGSQPEGGAQLCPQCGRELRRGARFCPHCGHRLGGEPRPSGDAIPAQPAYTPTPVPQPKPVYTQPPHQQREGISRYDVNAQAQQRRPAWALGLIGLVLSGFLGLCAVITLAVAPAFSKDMPPLSEVDPSQPDITILVQEAYISDMIGEALPEDVDGEAVLDIRPGNELVTTVDFTLLIVRLTVVVDAGIAVEDGQVAVWVESVKAGEHDVLGLVGVDQITLGENITGKIQDGLEEELGEGARLLTIVTDETHVILTARWE
ncbi:MAG: zinc-ribbon domain-containing protein [Anaerolineae bacterium]